MRKARKAGGVLDRATDVGTMVVFGLPVWWLGMMMIMIFSFVIPIFPSSGMHSAPPPEGAFAYLLDLLWHMALPVITLVILGFWARAYLTRNIVLSTLQEDFVMSARARGLPERKILFGHTLRSAAPPIATMTVLALLGSVGGSLLFEGIFSWPGMGNLYWVAVTLNDVPVLMGNLAVTTALYMAGLVLLDLVYGLLDPRIKVSGKA
jgi:peptide/nickel transport system permease protein